MIIPDQTRDQLTEEFAARRDKVYPAHNWLATHFPDYVEVMLTLDEVIRRKTRRYDERMHELFHIVALAVKGSNFHNQPHLRAHLKKGLELGLHPGEIGEALMVCVNPTGAATLTYGITCMLEAIEELKSEGWAEDESGKIVQQSHEESRPDDKAPVPDVPQ